MLELSNVTRAAGRTSLLTRVSLRVTRDAPTAIVGLAQPAREPLLRLLAGADRPQAGTIRLDGKDIATARRDRVIARIGGGGAPRSGQKVGKLLTPDAAARVRLSGRLDASVSDLDLDQRVRLAIGQAIARRPALLLLDAPASGLKLDARERFVADLAAMLHGCGAVVVMACEAADEAQGLAGHVAVLSGDGTLAQSGPAAEVFARPCNLAAALATSWPALNTLTMEAREDVARLADGSSLQRPEGVAMPRTGRCTLAFRPDDTALSRETPDCLRFVVRAAGEATVGGRRFARIAFADATWLAPLHTAPPPDGVLLNAFVDRSRLLVFDHEGRAVV